MGNLRQLDQHRSAVRFVIDLWQHDRRRFATAIGLSVAGSATESIGLLVLVPLVVSTGVVDGATSPIAMATSSLLSTVGLPFNLGSMLVVYIGLVALRSVVGLARQIQANRLRAEFVDALRVRYFEAVAHAKWRYHLSRRSSDISHTLTQDIPRVDGGASMLFDGIGQAITAAAYLFVAIRLSPWMVGISGILLLIMLGSMWWTVRWSRQAGIAISQLGRRTFSTQGEFLDALKLVKSHGSEREHLSLYRSDIDAIRKVMLDHQAVTVRSRALLQVGIAVSMAIMTWVGVRILDVHQAELLALIVIFARLATVGTTMLAKIQGAANMLPAYEAALHHCAEAINEQEQMEAGSTTGSANPIGTPHDDLIVLGETICLRDIGFSYGGDREAVDGIDLEIVPGAVVALVGPSGAGKSTIADLTIGLLEPQQGHVTVGGVPLAEFGLRRWRRQVAYVPQETFLFHDTLRANINWGLAQPLTEAELRQVINAAALDDVVTGLADGLDTILGDRGHRLSGGERQRVALARALARRPRLLVLDEATSALDTEHEREVQAAIDRLHGQVSMLVIAHRLSTVRQADQIVVVDNGKVVERGSWDELQASQGRLAELAAIDA